MRIYCDSNIFRKAKKTSNQFYKEVFDAMESLKDISIFLFSEAHLDDLSKSQEDFRNEDLRLMEHYVKDNHISRDHVKKRIKFLLATPIEAYGQRDYKASEAVLDNPYEYMQQLLDSDSVDSRMLKSLLNLTLFNLSHVDASTVPEEYHELFSKLKDLRTINDFLKNASGLGNFLNNPKEFKKIQKLLSNFVGRDTYSYDQWSFDFDQKLKETQFGKSFTELVEMTISESDKQDFYTAFINTYTGLESFGVTEERTGKNRKLKNDSFMDIHRDATHAFFATYADYFVTDDIGAQIKAFITYKLFEIDTQVLSTKDFVTKTLFLLKNEDDSYSFVDGIKLSLKTGLILDQITVQQQYLIKTLYPIFNYFDRLQVNGLNNSIQLFKSRSYGRGVMYAELELIIQKCVGVFGPPVGLHKEESLSELARYEPGDPIRTWRLGESVTTISWEQNNHSEKIIVMILEPAELKINYALSKKTNRTK